MSTVTLCGSGQPSDPRPDFLRTSTADYICNRVYLSAYVQRGAEKSANYSLVARGGREGRRLALRSM